MSLPQHILHISLRHCNNTLVSHSLPTTCDTTTHSSNESLQQRKSLSLTTYDLLYESRATYRSKQQIKPCDTGPMWRAVMWKCWSHELWLIIYESRTSASGGSKSCSENMSHEISLIMYMCIHESRSICWWRQQLTNYDSLYIYIYTCVTNYLLVEAASHVVRTWVTKYHPLFIYIYMSHELSTCKGSNSRTVTHYIQMYMSHELFAGGGSKSRNEYISH